MNLSNLYCFGGYSKHKALNYIRRPVKIDVGQLVRDLAELGYFAFRIMRKLLYPFSLLYGLITGIRNFLFDSGAITSKKFAFPVICIGNLSVGGTGKTPFTIYLAKFLSEKYKVAVLSRGYGRKTKGFRMVKTNDDETNTGDEPLLIKRSLPGAIVAVDEKRAEGIAILSKLEKPDLVILDDAFQHRYVKPSLSILLTTFNNPYWKDHLMPAGNLRESRGQAKRADIIIITKSPRNLPEKEAEKILLKVIRNNYQHLFFTTINYGRLRPIHSAAAPINPANGPILAVSAIADSSPMINHLRSIAANVVRMDFPDHHRFTMKDINRVMQKAGEINASGVVITEKDEVKWLPHINAIKGKERIFVLPITVEFLFDKERHFKKLIEANVRAN